MGFSKKLNGELKKENTSKKRCVKTFFPVKCFCVLAEKKTVSDKRLLRRFSISQYLVRHFLVFFILGKSRQNTTGVNSFAFPLFYVCSL